MFDKNLLLQHIGNRQRTVEQMLSEAKEGELHGRLKQAISKHYGIDPNHRNWSKIETPADINQYASSVYDFFPDEIDNLHRKLEQNPELTDPEVRRDREDRRRSVNQLGYQDDFDKFVTNLHRQLTRSKKESK